jgi:modulator of FtsH protease HflK
MPWNDNKGGGGGGWPPGGGGRGPWGQGPNNGGGRGQGPNIRPPDLDEVFKRGREWLKRMFPNQPLGTTLAALIGGAALVLWILTGVYVIQQQEQGVVLRFGRHVDLLQPGFHVRLPQPIETVIRQHVQQRQVNIGFVEDPRNPSAQPTNVPRESLMLTSDENMVDIDFTVLWRVRDAAHFSFNVLEPDETVKAVAESAMREAAGQSKYAVILAPGRGDVENRVREIMQETLDGYKAGVWVEKVNIRKVDPPAEVIDAARDVAAARQDKDRKRNVANAYAKSIVPRAGGEAKKILQDAEGYKQQQIAEAKGEAQRFISILEQYKNSKNVTRERMFLETMQKVLGSTNKIILQSGGNSPVVPYLPLPELRRSQSPSASSTVSPLQPPSASPSGAAP